MTTGMSSLAAERGISEIEIDKNSRFPARLGMTYEGGVAMTCRWSRLNRKRLELDVSFARLQSFSLSDLQSQARRAYQCA
jgi:hypothetical protein